jgi:hypothetical protein
MHLFVTFVFFVDNKSVVAFGQCPIKNMTTMLLAPFIPVAVR